MHSGTYTAFLVGTWMAAVGGIVIAILNLPVGLVVIGSLLIFIALSFEALILLEEIRNRDRPPQD